MRARVGLFFAIPGVLVLAGVVAFPLLYALLLSFSSYTFLKPTLAPFVGLAHYLEAFRDPYFLNSVKLTTLYAFLTVGLSLLIGLLIAVLLFQPAPGKEFYYAVISVPMLIAPVGVALIWKMILHPELGIVTYFFSHLGLEAPDFFGDPRFALFTLALVDTWQQVSFVALVLLAGLRSLPKEPLEAALVDGASPLQRFFHVTLPLLRPVIGVVLILQTIAELRTYDLVYVLTRGGPGAATDLLAYFIYRKAFLGLDLGGASALAYLLLLLTLALVVFYYRRVFQEV